MPFFADTNVCSNWVSDSVVKGNWERVQTSLEARGEKYVSCPLVLIELLAGLLKPEPRYFTSDLKRFAFLAGQGDTEFLAFPGAFVLKTVLKVESPVARFNASHFKQWLECVLAAPSREALDSGDVEMYGSELVSFGISFSVIKRQHEEGKLAHVERIARQRAAGYIPRPEDFAAGLLFSQGIIPKDNQELRFVAAALDAAFEYEKFLLGIDANYSFAKNSGDWVDQQLLYYLADPNVFIVTNDRQLQTRCVTSPQSSQVILI